MTAFAFDGTVEELMVRMASVGLAGDWQERPGAAGERFTLAMGHGLALHWTPPDGRVWLEGPEAAVAATVPRVADALTDP